MLRLANARLLSALSAAAMLTGPVLSQEASPSLPSPRPKPAPAAPDPLLESSRAAFEALTEAERRAVQDALVWTGDYNAVTAGTFGPRTFQGIVAWQKRSGVPADGILPKPQRAMLDAAGLKLREAVRFKLRTDPASGIAIGVPEKLLVKATPQPGGTRWQSADGRVTLDLKAFGAGETDLDALFERAAAVAPNRKVTYKVRKPDFIVVTGETETGRFFIRYAMGTEGIRGFSIGYDKALAGDVDRLVIAIANSFVPFPTTQAPTKAPPASETQASAPVPPALTKATEAAATGLVVGSDLVLTSSAALQGCRTPMIGGRPVRLAKPDRTGELTLLTLDPGGVQQPASTSLAIRSQESATDEPVMVLGSQGRDGFGVAPGVAGRGRVTAPLQPGAGGAPILDRAGGLAAIVAQFPSAPRRVAGIVPPTSYPVIPGAVIAAFLGEAGIPARQGEPTSQSSTGAAAGPYLRSIVSITCGN